MADTVTEIPMVEITDLVGTVFLRIKIEPSYSIVKIDSDLPGTVSLFAHYQESKLNLGDSLNFSFFSLRIRRKNQFQLILVNRSIYSSNMIPPILSF